MPAQPFALHLWVQSDKSRWIDYDMDNILERSAEMVRLEAYGGWCEALYAEAVSYPLLLTADGLEGAEALPGDLPLTAARQTFDPKGDNGKVIAHELRVGEQVLTQRPALVEAGIVWVTPRRQDAVVQLSPPVENIKQGHTCEGCKRFSRSDGQRWVNETTHAFSGEGQSKQMWHDVIAAIGRNTDVQLPNDPEDWGACLEHQRLVERTFPGCLEFVQRKVW
jgi:hypothetical protein